MSSPAPPDLDRLLAAWADARRLPEADAERILLAILPPVAPLEASWWTELNGKLSAVVTRATATPVPALAALVPAN